MSLASALKKLLGHGILLHVSKLQNGFREKSFEPQFCLNNDFIGRELMLFGRYERDELEWVRQAILQRDASKKFATVLDIGANIGNHTLFFAKYVERVLAFEPNPATYLVLRANLLINGRRNVEAYEFALGQEDGDAAFEINTSGNLGGSKIVGSSPSVGQRLSVRVRNGDAVLRELHEDTHVDLIKVDVEGTELEALSGLEHTLRRDLPVVIFEANTRLARQSIVSYLRSLSYSHFGYLSLRRAYSATRPIRWIQKLFDRESVSLYQLDDASEARHPVCIAFTQDHANRFGLGFVEYSKR